MSYNVEDTHVRRMAMTGGLQQAITFCCSKWKPGRVSQGIENITESMCRHLNSVASQYFQQGLESDSDNAENLQQGFGKIIVNTFI